MMSDQRECVRDISLRWVPEGPPLEKMHRFGFLVRAQTVCRRRIRGRPDRACLGRSPRAPRLSPQPWGGVFFNFRYLRRSGGVP